MWTRIVTVALLSAVVGLGQQPDVAAQKAAMKKLAFLAGKWSGDATARAREGELAIKQSEDIQFRLDGLVLLIEGTGREPESGKVVFNALAVVNYDDVKKEYRIRAFNSGHHTEAPFEVSDNGFAWGFRMGPVEVRNEMRVDDKGQWIETGTVTMEGKPPITTVRMTLKKD